MKKEKLLGFGALFCLLFIAGLAFASTKSSVFQTQAGKAFMQDGLARAVNTLPGGEDPPAAAYFA